jgi:uncharacterized membrane protein
MTTEDKSNIQLVRVPDRILSLTDGVFAFVLTLLVLDLAVPTLSSGASSGDLLAALSKEYVSFLAYVLSFIIAGAWWNGHHRVFGYIRRSNSTLQWLNLMFLIWITLLPFFTKLLSDYFTLQIVFIFYAADLAGASSLMTILWWYASRNHRLVDRSLKDSTIRFLLLLNTFITLWFVFSMGITFVSLPATPFVWFAIFPIRSLMNRLWLKR